MEGQKQCLQKQEHLTYFWYTTIKKADSPISPKCEKERQLLYSIRENLNTQNRYLKRQL